MIRIQIKTREKYGLKLIDHGENSTVDALTTTLKKVIQKSVEDTANLIADKIAEKITKLSRTSPQNIQGQLQIKGKKWTLLQRNINIYYKNI